MNAKVIIVTIIAALAGLLFGFDTAVISGTIPFVQSQYELTAALTGWFVSSALLGSILGVSVSGWFSDRFGRKNILIASAILFLLSAVGCALSNSFQELVVYRIFGGIAIGFASMVAPLYISEIAPKKHRGRLVTIYQLTITLGILGAYFSNHLVQDIALKTTSFNGQFHELMVSQYWRGMFAVELIPAIIFLIGMFFVPKSPRWLQIKGQIEEARVVSKELVIDLETPEDNKEKVALSTLFNGWLKKPMGIAIFLMMFSQLCGINAIIYYGPSILAEAGLSISDSLGGQVTIGIINCLFTFLAVKQIDNWGRRPLLMMGAIGVTIALLITSVLFFLNLTNGLWVVGSILLFIACYAFSLGPVQFVVAAEVFPTKYRAKAMSISTLILWGANAVVGQVFPILLESGGAALTFLLFGLICIPCVFFIFKNIPETKGKSLEEIENLWKTENKEKVMS